MLTARFRRFASAVHHPVLLVGPDGRVRGANAGALLLLGMQEPALLGLPLAAIAVDPDAADEQLRAWRSSDRPTAGSLEIRAGRGSRRVSGCGSRYEAEDGAAGWVLIGLDEASRSPARLELYRRAVEELSQEVHRRIALAGERDSLVERERAARREAEESARVKDEFLASVSHELRTPLNAILGWGQVLAHQDLERTACRAVDAIVRNARVQAELVEDLIDFSRVASGQVRLEEEDVDLSEVLRAAVDTVSPQARRKGVGLRLAPDAGRSVVPGDAFRLQQVVWNLLTNAVRHTPPGGHVDVSVEQDPSHLHVVVRDDGEGIEPDVLPVVFECFQQRRGRRDSEGGGLGLGLSIVRHIVDLHQGTVCAQSPGRGKGAVFTVSLPRQRGAPQVFRDEGPLARASNRRWDLTGMRILVVEDQEDSREMMAVTFQARGAEVVAVENAPRALQQMEVEAPDVLVSDIQMPGDDGYTLLRKVRAFADPAVRSVPAIAVTAMGGDKDRERALASGFHEHLGKPVDAHALLAAVARLGARSVRRSGSSGTTRPITGS